MPTVVVTGKREAVTVAQPRPRAEPGDPARFT